jgi:hypothetical protein
MTTAADGPVLNLVSPPISNIVALSGTLNGVSIGLTTPGPANFTTLGINNALVISYLAQYGVLLSGTASTIIVASPNIISQALVSNGPTAYPGFGLLAISQTIGVLSVPLGGTQLSNITSFGVMIGEGTGAVAVASPGVAELPLMSTGTGSNPAFSLLDLQVSISNILEVGNGGTSLSYLTPFSVLCGNGAGPVALAGPGPDGMPLISNGTAAFPSFQPLNLAGPGVTGILPAANANITPGQVGLFSGVVFGNSGTLTIPYNNLKISLIGGGGAGANASGSGVSPDTGGAGGGGGSGAGNIVWLYGLTIGQTINFTVGAGGSSPGANGGDTSISSGTASIPTVTAGGGNGGLTGGILNGGGAGGSPSSGDIPISGTPGNYGYIADISTGFYFVENQGGEGGALGLFGSFGQGGYGGMGAPATAGFYYFGQNGYSGAVIFEWLI